LPQQKSTPGQLTLFAGGIYHVPLRPLFVSLSLLFLGAFMVSLTGSSQAQAVTTWHNDIGRTGWQPSETVLTPANAIYHSFGKVFQYTVSGEVYAQPLAVPDVAVTGCHPTFPCDVIYVATEQDKLYGFDATGSTTSPFWSVDLAAEAGGTYLNCNSMSPPPPCSPNGMPLPEIGVTGTPVIDTTAGILYVVTFVSEPLPEPSEYYIHAINIQTGAEEPNSPYPINASKPGLAPSTTCGTSAGGSTVVFDAANHLQRSGLLLLNGTVYVAFAPADAGELGNGWIMGYTYNTASGFNQAETFISTPNGTGGGIWQGGAGPAGILNENGNPYIFGSTGNGTFDHNTGGSDYGDSMLRLNPNLTVSDYFTPGDVFNYGGSGLCPNDEDYGSSGVLLFPDSFVPGHPNVLLHADKESKLYIVDRDNLGQYVGPPGTDAVVQEVQTPVPLGTNQHYLSAPAYWEWTSGGTTDRAIYYAAQVKHAQGSKPLPLNMYQLASSAAPISGTPTASTGTLFCLNGTAPSTSSYGTSGTTGLVWAIEASNLDNQPGQQNPDCFGNWGPAVLHVYNANPYGSFSPLTQLYDSSGASGVGGAAGLQTPTVFKGRVYMGTLSEVDVFGLCNGCN
jgi:hypothetical protein